MSGTSPIDRVKRAVLWFERNEHRLANLENPPAPPGTLGPLFYNDSGETIPAYSVLKQTGEEMVDDEVIIKVGKPDVTYVNEYLLSGFAEILAGGVGRAQDAFRVFGSYSTGSPAAREGYGVKPGEWPLFKGFPCLLTVHKIRDSSRKIVQGRAIGGPPTILCKTVASVAAGASLSGAVAGAYKIYAGTKGSEADAGFTSVPAVWFRNALAADKWFKATWINDGLEGEPLTC